MTYRVRNIGIAVALAIVAALLTSFYVTNYKRHVQRGEDHVTVLVAKHDIPVGTAGSDAKSMISTAQDHRRSRPAAFRAARDDGQLGPEVPVDSVERLVVDDRLLAPRAQAGHPRHRQSRPPRQHQDGAPRRPQP